MFDTLLFMGRPLSCILTRPEDVAVIDCEASSLRGALQRAWPDAKTSYPIEVAYALSNGFTRSWLIKPEPGWVDWNGTAENSDIGQIHGISRTELFEKGHDVRAVARELNAALAGKIVLCDSGHKGADHFWVKRLFDAAGEKQQFEMYFFYDLIDLNLDDDTLAALGAGQDMPHRAAGDARILMDFYERCYNHSIAMGQPGMSSGPYGVSL